MVEKTNHDGDFGDLGHDGLLEGGPLGGQVGWEEKGGKELFFGTISVVAAPFTIGGGIVAIAEESVVMGYGYIFAGGVGGLNGLDDMLTNTQRESFTQQLTSDPNWKANIGSF